MSSPGPSGQLRATTVPVLRLTFTIVGIAALALGFVGLEDFLRENAQIAHDPLDVLYYDLQLFVLGSAPLEQGATSYPVTLQIARFAAPAVTIFAVVEAARLILSAELRRVRIRRARGHAVVCGGSSIAYTLAGRLHADGYRVVLVDPKSLTGPELRGRRAFAVAGDPMDPEVLRDAGAGRAAVLYACTDDSARNASIALAAGRIARGATQPLAVYAQVLDPELCLALQARRLGQSQPSGLRLDFFNVDDLAARTLFTREPLDFIDGRPPRLLVAGASAFGRALIVAAARHWRLLGGPSALPIHLVGPNASQALDGLSHRYPFLARVCRITTHDTELPALLANGSFPEPPDRIYICAEDEEYGLRTALTVQTLWRGGPRSVVVRLDRLAGFAEAFHGRSGDGLLDEVSGKLRLYQVVEAAGDPRLIGEDLVERLARVIHEHYLLAQAQRSDPTQGRSHVPWERLPEEYRRSNRAQAEDIGRKLRQIECVLAPRVVGADPAELGEDEVELLAEREHTRWMVERTANGWRPGVRDDARHRHPDLRAWAELAEPVREKNRDFIRELPALLADAGFQIVRIAPAQRPATAKAQAEVGEPCPASG